uniref:Uncharacterized protein n=1 Tax=Arundo donax TaxID=35708 RepID=A0A0A9GCG7_ARUDO
MDDLMYLELVILSIVKVGCIGEISIAQDVSTFIEFLQQHSDKA